MNLKKQYSTKQRNLILEFFKTHENECFPAKYFIKEKDFNFGNATVYRLLSKLAGEGKLKRFINDKDTGATYQYNNTELCLRHFHLKCLTCGETVCVDCSFMDGFEKHVEHDHNFEIDNSKTVIYGICKECHKK